MAAMSPAARYGALGVLLVATGLLVWSVAGDAPSTAPSPQDYTVSAREQIPELGTVGQVLVPSMTRANPARESQLRAIAEQEELAVAFFFSTTDAMNAHRSAARDGPARAALSDGFLGRLTRGEFTPGEEIFP